jgi:leucyl-tRNA synthetase
MKKQYVLVMFPYPSGNGLHVGHHYNYSIMDSYCNMLRYQGVEVFQPFGYDAFGLPAENYAKKVGRDPREVTYENIDKFREQMQHMNTKYEELLITSDPSYQKWTQWLFLKLKEAGLAYKKQGEVNWCPSCATVLANEQVKEGKCERCDSTIEMKTMEQWYFKITQYRDRLIKNLDFLDYPKSTIEQQRHWLANLHDWCVSRQRKWGCPIPVEGETDTLDTFVDSSFYYVRYCDPNNDEELCSPAKYQQVDLYVGGPEHACMHLIYARFIHMFLYDLGVVPVEEPFRKLVHQGMIRSSQGGEKMSKSKGNTISPDNYNQDVLRFYLMFLGPYTDGGEWSDQHIQGVVRFMGRMTTWLNNAGEESLDLTEFKERIFNYTKSFKVNKVVSEFMILLNKNKHKKLNFESRQELTDLMRIYAPGFR